MRLIDWQYYPKWHLSFDKCKNSYGNYAWWEYWITIGPIQTNWGGKPWCTHLKRSPEYVTRMKKNLLEELKTVEFK